MHSSFATRPNLDLLEQNYERWQNDPDSLDSGWSAFFEGFELGSLDGRNGAAVEAPSEARRDLRESPLQARIDALVYAYRILGHTIARVNPLAENAPKIRFLLSGSSVLATKISTTRFPQNSSSIIAKCRCAK